MVPVDTSKYPGALFPADRLRAFQFDNYEGKQLPDPLEICIYNLELSAWFHQRLSVLEIVLRNSLFDQLSKKFFDGTTAWAPSLLGQLDESRLNDFHRAKTRLSHASKIPTDSQVVTELNFGFWRQMPLGGQLSTFNPCQSLSPWAYPVNLLLIATRNVTWVTPPLVFKGFEVPLGATYSLRLETKPRRKRKSRSK